LWENRAMDLRAGVPDISVLVGIGFRVLIAYRGRRWRGDRPHWA
jgi:hypothetical protein